MITTSKTKKANNNSPYRQFYSSRAMRRMKIRKFFTNLLSAAIFAFTFIIIMLMGISDEMCKAVCVDLVDIGIIVIASRLAIAFIPRIMYKNTHQRSSRRGTR